MKQVSPPNAQQSLLDASGSSSSIQIQGRNISLSEGSAALIQNLGAQPSGGMIVNATESLNLTGNTPDGKLGSLIQIENLGKGQMGDVNIFAAQLSISGVLSLTFSASGNANDMFVNTSRLVIRDGGILGSTTVAAGAAGSVTLNASKSVDIKGRISGSTTPSRIASTAEILDPVTQAAFGFPAIPSGNAGSLTINTPSLRITDGATVTVKNDGSGSAGDLKINANSIFLNNQGHITASTASGNGGNVKLNLQDYLLMRHDSLISATAVGNGNGGNLSINAPVIVGLENSDIIANALQGNGGNINITTQDIFGLKYRNQLTSDSDITASSQFGVNGTVNINNFGVDPNSGLVELPANLTDPSQQIASGCSANQGSSFVATGRGGIPENPTQEVRSDVYDGLRLRTWSDIRDLTAYRNTQALQAQIPKSPEVLVQATGWRRNASNANLEKLYDGKYI